MSPICLRERQREILTTRWVVRTTLPFSLSKRVRSGRRTTWAGFGVLAGGKLRGTQKFGQPLLDSPWVVFEELQRRGLYADSKRLQSRSHDKNAVDTYFPVITTSPAWVSADGERDGTQRMATRFCVGARAIGKMARETNCADELRLACAAQFRARN
jgi:hypothetical protein